MGIQRNRSSIISSLAARSSSHRALRSARILASLLVCLWTGAANADSHAATPGKKLGVAAIDAFIAQAGIKKDSSDWKSSVPRPPKVEFDAGKKYYWMLKTNVGSIKVQLHADGAPMHVSSTIYLTRIGFYDDTKFHRVISGFMAQGGDPTGTGRGGPGYKYAGEFSSGLKHDSPGILSMANAGPKTDGSQFFLTFTPTPHLNGKHTVFGKVVEGMGTVRELEQNGSRGGAPSKNLFIEKATILVE